MSDLKELIISSTMHLSAMITLWGLTNYAQYKSRGSIANNFMFGWAVFTSMASFATLAFDLVDNRNCVKKLN